MENIIMGITEVIGAVKAIDWAAFFIVWLSVERVLRAVSRLTPWQWDDDLVNWVAEKMPKKKPDA